MTLIIHNQPNQIISWMGLQNCRELQKCDKLIMNAIITNKTNSIYSDNDECQQWDIISDNHNGGYVSQLPKVYTSSAMCLKFDSEEAKHLVKGKYQKTFSQSKMAQKGRVWLMQQIKSGANLKINKLLWHSLLIAVQKSRLTNLTKSIKIKALAEISKFASMQTDEEQMIFDD